VIEKYLETTRADRFQWGVNDCALWVAGLVHAATGTDIADDLRGTYSTWWECRQVLFKHGGLEGLAHKRLNFLNKNETKNGVGLVKFGSRTTAGILLDGQFYMKRNRGLRMVSNFELLQGWSCLKL